jgi:hypothetical protein
VYLGALVPRRSRERGPTSAHRICLNLREFTLGSRFPVDQAQDQAKYSDAIRDLFIARRRFFRVISVTDTAFVADLQISADRLTAHRLLPGPIVVANHLARL